jgi:beta-galactosidase
VAPTSAMEEVCVNVTDFVAAVNVTYVPGELTATLHASSNTGIVDEAIASKTFNTAGPPASIRLSTDRSQITASRDDLSYIRAELVDAHGSRVECGSYRGAFNLSGRPAFSPPAWCAPTRVSFALDNMADAEIAAVGSGDPLDVDSFLGSSRRTYRGLATAIIRPGKTGREAPPTAGTLTLTAAAAGSGASAVKGGTIKVEVLA